MSVRFTHPTGCCIGSLCCGGAESTAWAHLPGGAMVNNRNKYTMKNGHAVYESYAGRFRNGGVRR